MNWDNLEKAFHRALFLSFSKKKLFMVSPILILCGILVVFARALAVDASGWIIMSLIFLPLFLSSGLLLSLGVLLIKIYQLEIKQLKVNFRELLSHSWEVMIGTSYLSIPPILVYLFLWILLGVFLLLKEIPGLGNFIGVVLAFGPFLLILSSLVLVLFNLGLLFFVTPAVSLKSQIFEKKRLAHKVVERLKTSIFSNLVLFLVALSPLAFVVGILSLAAMMTNINYLVSQHTLSIALQWFFIMLPFSFLLSPTVIFFFNFAAETQGLMQNKLKAIKDPINKVMERASSKSSLNKTS